ncbi:condensation domain-containing protein [Actinoplanes sp. NPDC049548]|uniref:condensation domain-containing protein n=1 Tax=Actinoplanes sp. NPDC049548 TaxID=3155152 RepID=UPI003432905F
MTDLSSRLAALTPEQRERLRRLAGAARDAAPVTDAPLTPGQRRLWDTQLAYPGLPVDVVCQAVRLDGPVDLDRLAAGLAAFTARHPVLRTTFAVVDGEPRQTVHTGLTADIRRASCPGGDEQAYAMARELAREPFDLARGPLLRAVLAEAGPDRSWLLLAVHNLVFDAWSFELLLDQLAEPPTGDPPPGFVTVARRRDAWVAGPAGREAAAHWAAVAADPPPPVFPVGPERTGIGRRREFTLPADVGTALTAVARAEGCTPFAAWCAVLWSLLSEWSGNPDVLFGTFTANRGEAGTDEVAGYLLNVVPVRLRDPGSGSFRDRVRGAAGPVRDVQRHGAYPAELIGLPPFEVAFVFENLGDAGRTIQGARVTTADVDKGTARYDVTVSVFASAQEGRLHGWIEYDTGRLDDATADRLATRFAELAVAAAVDADPGGVPA